MRNEKRDTHNSDTISMKRMARQPRLDAPRGVIIAEIYRVWYTSARSSGVNVSRIDQDSTETQCR